MKWSHAFTWLGYFEFILLIDVGDVWEFESCYVVKLTSPNIDWDMNFNVLPGYVSNLQSESNVSWTVTKTYWHLKDCGSYDGIFCAILSNIVQREYFR